MTEIIDNVYNRILNPVLSYYRDNYCTDGQTITIDSLIVPNKKTFIRVSDNTGRLVEIVYLFLTFDEIDSSRYLISSPERKKVINELEPNFSTFSIYIVKADINKKDEPNFYKVIKEGPFSPPGKPWTIS